MKIRLTLRPGCQARKNCSLVMASGWSASAIDTTERPGDASKTAELIVEDVAWAGRARKPRRNDSDLVGVRIAWKETELRASLKRAGGIWRPRQRLWELSWNAVRTLGLHGRVVE